MRYIDSSKEANDEDPKLENGDIIENMFFFFFFFLAK